LIEKRAIARSLRSRAASSDSNDRAPLQAVAAAPSRRRRSKPSPPLQAGVPLEAVAPGRPVAVTTCASAKRELDRPRLTLAPADRDHPRRTGVNKIRRGRAHASPQVNTIAGHTMRSAEVNQDPVNRLGEAERARPLRSRSTRDAHAKRVATETSPN
jgi:hypothetical protein